MAQIMAWSLTAPSHYLNQYWLKILGSHSSRLRLPWRSSSVTRCRSLTPQWSLLAANTNLWLLTSFPSNFTMMSLHVRKKTQKNSLLPGFIINKFYFSFFQPFQWRFSRSVSLCIPRSILSISPMSHLSKISCMVHITWRWCKWC